MTKRVVIGVLGIRDFDDQEIIHSRLDKFLGKLKNDDSVVKSFITTDEKGSCALVRDYLGSKEIPCKVYAADWDGNGKAAGFMRSEYIIGDSQTVIVFWDGECQFLQSLINKILAARKLVKVIRVEKTEKAYYPLKDRPRTEKVLQR